MSLDISIRFISFQSQTIGPEMSLRSLIKGRNEQLGLISAFIRPETLESPPAALIYGGPATGKSFITKLYLDHSQINDVWIDCDDCVSLRIVLKRVLERFQELAGDDLGDDFLIDRSDTVSFDSFVSTLREIFVLGKIEKHHYVVLDRADRLIEGDSDIYRKFVRLMEIARIPNLSIVFITSTQPRELITFAVPTIYFEPYSNIQITEIIGDIPLCCFSKGLNISKEDTKRFWQSYVGIIVETYFPYTTNLNVLKRIAIKLWDKFTKDIENGNLKINQFLAVYRQNIGLLSSNYAFESNLTTKETLAEETEEDEEEVKTHPDSGFSIVSKYIIIAGYLASFNDSKYDWVFFSKLKDFHKKKQHFRTSKFTATKLNARLLEPSPFELERLLAITHAIYVLENAKPLTTDIDIGTQIANLSTLKILLKSNNNDYISARTRWKINVNFQYVKALSEELGFPLENYLAE